jgi:di/tricarboxylate transporter
MWHNREKRGKNMRFLLFIGILLALIFLMETILVKFFGIEKKKLSESPGKKTDKRGRNVIMVVSIIFLLIIGFNDPADELFIAFGIFNAVAAFGYQAAMEWIYLRETKQHILSLACLLFIVIFLLNYKLLAPLLFE